MIRARKAVACIISMSVLILGQIAWAEGQATDPMAPIQRMNASELDLPERISESKERTISGSGEGELLISLSFSAAVPVVSGSYSYNISGIRLPPFSTPVQLKSSGAGYDLKLPGILVLSRPNDIALTASPVKSMNVALMRLDGGTKGAWASSQFGADRSNQAKAKTDLVYPNGTYNLRVFGDAPPNATMVELTLSAEKKFIIDGPFNLVINTAGFPSGGYSVRAEAINGSFELEKIGFAWSDLHQQ